MWPERKIVLAQGRLFVGGNANGPYDYIDPGRFDDVVVFFASVHVAYCLR